jgi:hypothetical protein
LSPELLDPTGASASATTDRQSTLAARRISSLDGKTVGLLNNTKVKADYILDAVEVLLKERYNVKEFVRRTKPTFSRPIPDDMAEEMASQCDVVITAIGS